MMAGRAELRVVRCPKCDSLLPGKLQYTVFRCGGCGAVLRGKSKPGVGGGSETTLSLKSDEEENFSGSDHHQVKSSGERRRRIIGDNNQYSDDHATIQNWVAAAANADGRSSIDTDNGRRYSQSSTCDSGGYVEKWMNDSKVKEERWRLDNEGISSSSSSSYHHSAEFYHGHEMNNFMGDHEAADKIRHIENHEQEILRKLDEIKDQLINRRSAINNVVELDRAKEKDDKLRPFSRRAVRPPNYANQSPAPPFNSNNKPFDKPAISPFSYRDTHPEYHHDPTASYNAAVGAYPQIIKPPNIQRVPRYGLDVPSKSGSVAGDVQRRTDDSTYNNKRSRPIFGAAPFIICPGCFELLKLPKKSMKFCCGACSTTLQCAVTHHKKLLVSIHEETKEAAAVDLQCDNKFSEKGFAKSSPGHANNRDSKISSHFSSFEDYNHSGYEFDSMDSSSRCPPKQILSGDTETTHCSIDQSKLVSPVKPPPPAGATLQELFNYSTSFHRPYELDKGNRSRSRSSDDHGKVLGRKPISSKPEFLEKQADTSLQYSNLVVSHDSRDTTTREDDDEARKTHRKGLKYYSKESFSDFSISSSQDQENEDDAGVVTVNGYVIPDHLVKKAERMSGPIQPGDYWYDFKAGFWGVMDGPCLGIIPPSIEEFNYRMQEKCSCGNTGIYVNGRELHQKDMEMLGKRGLPTTPHKSYIVEISGKVWDADSGEELFTLRKLAPTVEKLNRGFGIRVHKMS